MIYTKFVCLAVSRKYQAKCIAGRKTSDNKWIRPVSDTEKGEIDINKINYIGGYIPRVLDIIKMPRKNKMPKSYQPENVLIGEGNWYKVGEYKKEKLELLCDQYPILWNNSNPAMDRISEEYLLKNKVQSSLLLIRINKLYIECKDWIKHDGSKNRRIRAIFNYNEVNYNLALTDSKVEEEYKNKGQGRYVVPSNKVYLCISLGQPFKGDCYKLVTSVINCNYERKREKLDECKNKELYEELKTWRLNRANKQNIPAFCVAHNSTLKEIVKKDVNTIQELWDIRGIGKNKIRKYGEEIINVIENFKKDNSE